MPRPKRAADACPYEAATHALKRIGGRWKVLILRLLLDGEERGFAELRRALPGVSAKMLAQQLRELEADGLVTRTELVRDPPKTVRYGLTDLGRALRPTLDAVAAWGRLARRAAPVPWAAADPPPPPEVG